MKRRLVLAASAAFTVRALGAGPKQLPLAASLPDELQLALRAKAPLVVMVSLDGCAYCAIVREQHLVPLRAGAGQPIVQVDLRSDRPLVDLGGQLRTHDHVARSWGIDATPTLLFLGDEGREVAPRLRGASIPDFYGAYLADRLEIARRRLGR